MENTSQVSELWRAHALLVGPGREV